MTTISGLPNKPSGPLTGAEVIPADQSLGGTTERFTAGDVATLGELYAALHLGAAPDRMDANGTYFSTQGAGEPVATWYPPAMELVASLGYAARVTAGGPVYQRGVIAGSSALVWQVEADVEQVSIGAGENPVFQVGLASLKSDFTTTSGTNEAYGPLVTLAAGQIATISWQFSALGGFNDLYSWRDQATAAFLRPLVRANVKSDLTGFCANSVARIRRFKVRDISAVRAAQDAARSRRFFSDRSMI